MFKKIDVELLNIDLVFTSEISKIAQDWFRKYEGEYKRVKLSEVSDLEQELWLRLFDLEDNEKKFFEYYKIYFLGKDLAETDLSRESGRYRHLYANKYLDRKPQSISREYYPNEFRIRNQEKVTTKIFCADRAWLLCEAEKIADKLRKRGSRRPVEIPLSQLKNGESRLSKNLFYSIGPTEDDYSEESFS